jgi:chromosome segregation ATPase
MSSALIIGGLVALVLLVMLFWRAAGQIAELNGTISRLEVVQRDMTSDVRRRLQEGAETWESVESDIRPRVDQLETAVADLGASVEENLPAMTEARRRLVRVEERVAEVAAAVQEGLGAAEETTNARLERIEEAIRTLRDAADGRLGEIGERLSALETPPEPEPGSPPEAEADVVAALEAATDAPATFGEGRPREEPRRKQRRGSRWRFWRSRSQ